MKHLVRISRTFEASHQMPAGACSKLHGHSWVMGIVYETSPGADRDQARRLLEGIVLELDGKHLNEQLPASIPDTSGVAAWAFERLDMVLEGLIQTECELAFAERAICER